MTATIRGGVGGRRVRRGGGHRVAGPGARRRALRGHRATRGQGPGRPRAGAARGRSVGRMRDAERRCCCRNGERVRLRESIRAPILPRRRVTSHPRRPSGSPSPRPRRHSSRARLGRLRPPSSHPRAMFAPAASPRAAPLRASAPRALARAPRSRAPRVPRRRAAPRQLAPRFSSSSAIVAPRDDGRRLPHLSGLGLGRLVGRLARERDRAPEPPLRARPRRRGRGGLLLPPDPDPPARPRRRRASPSLSSTSAAATRRRSGAPAPAPKHLLARSRPGRRSSPALRPSPRSRTAR